MSDFDFTGILDVPTLAGVDPGTTLLVAGSAMVGTAALVRSGLRDGARLEEGVVAITTNRSAVDVFEEIRAGARRHPRHGSRESTAGGRTDGTGEDTAHQWYRYRVDDPGDVTGMGIGITNSFERLRTAGADRIRLGLDTLSAMVTYSDPETVFTFCHVLTSRIGRGGYLGVFSMGVAAHDEQAVQVVTQPFDGLIEVRDRDGVREARVRGLSAPVAVGAGVRPGIIFVGVTQRVWRSRCSRLPRIRRNSSVAGPATTTWTGSSATCPSTR